MAMARVDPTMLHIDIVLVLVLVVVVADVVVVVVDVVVVVVKKKFMKSGNGVTSIKINNFKFSK